MSILKSDLILNIESFCFMTRKLEHLELFERSKKLEETIARNNVKRQMNTINSFERVRSCLQNKHFSNIANNKSLVITKVNMIDSSIISQAP